jgi:predicted site-specific integrase-resolvase
MRPLRFDRLRQRPVAASCKNHDLCTNSLTRIKCGFAYYMCEMESDMATYGYARLSTDGQSLAAQLAELKAAKCEKIFQEKISGARSDRKQLAKLMALLAKDDVLVVTRLDRLARSTRDLLNLLGTIGDSLTTVMRQSIVRRKGIGGDYEVLYLTRPEP